MSIWLIFKSNFHPLLKKKHSNFSFQLCIFTINKTPCKESGCLKLCCQSKFFLHCLPTFKWKAIDVFRGKATKLYVNLCEVSKIWPIEITAVAKSTLQRLLCCFMHVCNITISLTGGNCVSGEKKTEEEEQYETLLPPQKEGRHIPKGTINQYSDECHKVRKNLFL